MAGTEIARTLAVVGDLVEQVLGRPEPLPRDANQLTLLAARLRQHLPRLERIARKQSDLPKGRALLQQARRLRACTPPEGHMPLVIHTIWLAEVAQALITALKTEPAATHAAVQELHGAEGKPRSPRPDLHNAPHNPPGPPGRRPI